MYLTPRHASRSREAGVELGYVPATSCDRSFCIQAQADPTISARSWCRGSHPRSRLISSLLAIRVGGSPGRLGANLRLIGSPVTASAVSSTSLTEYPSPPQPRL